MYSLLRRCIDSAAFFVPSFRENVPTLYPLLYPLLYPVFKVTAGQQGRVAWRFLLLVLYVYLYIHLKKKQGSANCSEQHVSPAIFRKNGKTGYKNKKTGQTPLKMRRTQFMPTGYKSGYKRVHFPPGRVRYKAFFQRSVARSLALLAGVRQLRVIRPCIVV